MSSAELDQCDACPYCRVRFDSFTAVLDHLRCRGCHQIYTKPPSSKHRAEPPTDHLAQYHSQYPFQCDASVPQRDASALLDVYKPDLLRSGGSTTWGSVFAPSMLEQIWLPQLGAFARAPDHANGGEERQEEREEERPCGVTCPQCGAKLSNNGNLNRHIRAVHSDIRRFRCKYCQWAFYQKSELQSHLMRVHYSVRAHRCGQCEKSFTRKEHLLRHVQSGHSSPKRRRRK